MLSHQYWNYNTWAQSSFSDNIQVISSQNKNTAYDFPFLVSGSIRRTPGHAECMFFIYFHVHLLVLNNKVINKNTSYIIKISLNILFCLTIWIGWLSHLLMRNFKKPWPRLVQVYQPIIVRPVFSSIASWLQKLIFTTCTCHPLDNDF